MNWDLIVVGAGISGLSMAFYAARAGKKVLILEKSSRIGGCFHSEPIDSKSDFWIEMGAHACYRSYASLIEILEALQIQDSIQGRSKAPIQFYDQDQFHSPISKLSWLELFCSAPKIAFSSKNGQSIQEYYSKIIGSNNFKRVFGPMFNAVISQNADAFPADTLFKKRNPNPTYPKNFTFKYGLSTVSEAIAAYPGITILCNHEVNRLDFDGQQFSIHTENKVFHSTKAALACPAHRSRELLSAVFPDLSHELRDLQVGQIESMAMYVHQDSLKMKPSSYLIAPDQDFFSVVTRDVYPHPEYRGFTFHFKPDRLKQTEKQAKILQVLNLQADQVLAWYHKNDQSVPSLRVGHQHLVQALDVRLAKCPLALTGNYFEGVAIEDCLLRSKSEFKRLFLDFAHRSYACQASLQ